MKSLNKKSDKNAIHDAKCCANCIYFSEHTVRHGFCEKHPEAWVKITQICNLFVGIGAKSKLGKHSRCPKCGSRRVYIPPLGEWDVYYYVNCRDCLFSGGPYETSKKKTWEAYEKEVEQKKLEEMKFAESMKRLIPGWVK